MDDLFGTHRLVADRSHAETFVTRALAESFRTELMATARAGDAFDEVTGLLEARVRDYVVVRPCPVLRGHQMAAGSGQVPQIHRQSIDDSNHGAATPPTWPTRRRPNPLDSLGQVRGIRG